MPLFFSVAAALGATTAHAADGAWPNQPIKIIVPFAPGGGSDFIARFVATQMTAKIGQTVIVENRPGAGGLLGVELAVKAPSDGYTLALVASSYAVNPALYKLKFDPINDITPIIQLSQGPMLIVAKPEFAGKTVKGLMAMAKAKPGSITFASAGQGSVTHLAAELFASKAGVKMTHVPYKGTGPALTDTMGGQVDVFFATTATALPHVQSNKLRGIAVTTSKRAVGLLDVPTIAEAGLPGYEAVIWHGLIGPKGIPNAIVEKLNAAAAGVLKQKESTEKLQSDGVVPAGGSAKDFGALIKKDIALWQKVVTDAGVKVE